MGQGKVTVFASIYLPLGRIYGFTDTLNARSSHRDRWCVDTQLSRLSRWLAATKTLESVHVRLSEVERAQVFGPGRAKRVDFPSTPVTSRCILGWGGGVWPKHAKTRRILHRGQRARCCVSQRACTRTQSPLRRSQPTLGAESLELKKMSCRPGIADCPYNATGFLNAGRARLYRAGVVLRSLAPRPGQKGQPETGDRPQTSMVRLAAQGAVPFPTPAHAYRPTPRWAPFPRGSTATLHFPAQRTSVLRLALSKLRSLQPTPGWTHQACQADQNAAAQGRFRQLPQWSAPSAQQQLLALIALSDALEALIQGMGSSMRLTKNLRGLLNKRLRQRGASTAP